MPPHVRLALVRYVECGGTLLVIGQWEAPRGWTLGGRLADGGEVYDAVFGRCLVTGSHDVGAYTRSAFDESVNVTFAPWHGVKTIVEAHESLPVVEHIDVPVRGMLVLMLAFVVLAGPVNLLVLCRKGKRIYLFWTVPVLSLLTCGLVFGYSVFSEGFRGRYRTLSLTVLDENTNRATSLGWTAFYSPLTPGEGLHFSYHTELSPQLASRRWGFWGGRDSSAGSNRTVDWTQDQHLATGWVSARVPAHFALRKSENRRERLTVRTGPGGTLTLVNGLGVGISRIVLADQARRLHVAENVPAGSEAAMALMPGTPQGRSLRDVYAADWLKHIVRLEPEVYLKPGTYIATLEENPFVEKGLRGAEPEKCQTVVYGILKGRGRGS